MKLKHDSAAPIGVIEIELTGDIRTELVTPEEGLIKQINKLGAPVKLTADDVNIRRCWLVGDAVNDQNGRFRTKDIPKLLKLINGAPVLIAHDKSRLAIGKWFGGSVEQDGDVKFIVPYLYWMREASNAEDLRLNIDGGIWNSASLGFSFAKPTCSICSEDIRNGEKCPHLPGEEYDDKLCYVWYDNIITVKEGSICWGSCATKFWLPT